MISIVIPTFNEVKNIIPLIKNLIVLISDFEYEIIVVDDDSPDGTSEEVNTYMKMNKRIKLITRIGRSGLSSAIKEGLIFAQGKYLLVLDGDGQHHPSFILNMLEEIQRNKIKMNSFKKKIEWDKYIIALSPIFLNFYISNETYAIDYRAFYLAGKSVLNNLNPYLNHISLSSDFYGPINSELSKFSGWKYPPLASYIFTPLASLPYEISKNIFNLISLLSVSLLTFFIIKRRLFNINP